LLKNKPKDKREEKELIECEFKISKKCLKKHYVSLRSITETKERNEGKYICLQCSRTLKFSGRKNPNCKYVFDDNFFKKINSEEKAYVLGWIASDGHVSKSGFRISINEKDLLVLKWIKDIFSVELPVYRKIYSGESRMVTLQVCSQQMSMDICSWLRISPGKKSHVVCFPELESDFLKWAFLRGYFDGDGFVSSVTNNNSPRCGISSSSKNMLEYIFQFVGAGSKYKNQIEWQGNNALDFLGKLYDGASIFLNRKKNLYEDWCLWVPSLSNGSAKGRQDLFCKFNKTRKDAVIPFKNRVSDSGYDLTILEKVREIGDVEFYSTGIKIQPCFGYYFDVVPRSSISKTGYMLANSIGIIDRTYVGEILVPLRKVDKLAAPLELPCKIVQIIPRQIVHFEFIEVCDFLKTDRGSSGFGSSGK
jgi:deoxyuridine 5'-triphosphate nucleotidohydrolase